MKKYILFIGILLGLFSCNSNNKSSNSTQSDTTGIAKIDFVEEVHDFGEVLQGERVTHTFKFTNSGDADLIINNVKASCGCTKPEYNKEPIAPGTEGEITVTFDSSNREGNQYKKITITANSEPQIHELVITCNVVKS